MKMCPAEALSRNEETGAVVVAKERCLGCHTCVYVCPFGAPAVDPITGVCEKCTLCDGDPHCVKVCAKEALTFGDDFEEGPHRKRAGSRSTSSTSRPSPNVRATETKERRCPS